MKAQTVPLEDAFWFQEGPGVRKWQFAASGIKLLNVGNILSSGEVDLSKTDRFLRVEEVKTRYKHFLVDEGDLVIASSGISFDNDGLLRTRGAFIERAHLPLCLNTSTIRFKSRKGADLRYLRFWLDSQEFRSQITRRVTGSAQQNFGPSHLQDIKITLPAFSEQKRIAGLLEQADRLRRTRRYALELSDTFLFAVFNTLFGDPLKNPHGYRLEKLGNLLRIPPALGTTRPCEPNASFRCVRVGEVGSDKIDLDSCGFVNLSDSERRRFMVNVDDILLARAIGSEDQLGKLSICQPHTGVLAFDSHLMRARVDPSRLLPQFLAAFLRSSGGRRLFMRQARRTAVQFNINAEQLSELVIPLPPVERQQHFAKLVNRNERLRACQREVLRQADHLFQSLLNRAFT